jgi:hypothetical protein
MSTTNQAFIKAYRRDDPEASPLVRPRAVNAVRGPGARATVSAGTPARGVAEILSASVAYVTPEMSCPAETIAQLAAASTNSTASEARSAITTLPDAFPIAEPRAGDVASGGRTDRPAAGAKRPLSSFTSRGPRAATPSPTPATATLRPGTIVASFQWPDICRQLLRRHAKLFDRAVESLLTERENGQTLFGALGLFRNVGTSTTALCLATRLAHEGRRVILVDGHFQSPRLGEYLGAQPTSWWQDVLERDAPLGDALIRSEDDRFDLLPLYPEPPRQIARGALANGIPFSATAGALRHAYDLALVDLGTFFDPQSQPTALRMISAMRLGSVIAVTGPGRNDPRDMNTLVERLEEFDCQLLGLIENRAA